MAVAAITFDFWCTLFGDSAEVADRRRQVRIDALTKATGVTEEAAKAAHKKAADVFMRHHVEEQCTLGPPEALAIMTEACGVTLPSRLSPPWRPGCAGSGCLRRKFPHPR